MMDGGGGAPASTEGRRVLLNKWQLAEALGVSGNTIDRWRQSGMPVVAEGSNGRAYAFDAGECLAWREARDAEADAERRAAEEHVRQLRLDLDPVAATRREHLSPAEQRESYEAALRYMQAARQRRELVQAEQVVDMLEGAFGAIRDAMEALPDALAREIGLSGDQVERVVVYCDQVLDVSRRRCAELVDGLDEARGKAGDDAA
jgi:phage terminase Nu1 subunit (DNA packaging protein)